MARGGWTSASVFRTFYAKTKHKRITLERLRQTQCDREHKDAPRHGMPDLEETPSGDMAIAPSGDMPVEGEGSLRESPMTYSPGALRRPKATSATERSHKDGHRPSVKESTKMLREHKDASKPVGEGSPRESPVVFKLGLRTESSSGQPLAIPGSQLREGTMRYCSCC